MMKLTRAWWGPSASSGHQQSRSDGLRVMAQARDGSRFREKESFSADWPSGSRGPRSRGPEHGTLRARFEASRMEFGQSRFRLALIVAALASLATCSQSQHCNPTKSSLVESPSSNANSIESSIKNGQQQRVASQPLALQTRQSLGSSDGKTDLLARRQSSEGKTRAASSNHKTSGQLEGQVLEPGPSELVASATTQLAAYEPQASYQGELIAVDSKKKKKMMKKKKKMEKKHKEWKKGKKHKKVSWDLMESNLSSKSKTNQQSY